jgi:hypothetical protein
MKNEIQKLILCKGIKGASAIVKNYEKAVGFIINDIQDKIIHKLKAIPALHNIRKQDEPFFSIFLNVNSRTIGIESFDLIKKSHRRNSLFIGELDFNRESDPKNIVHSFWLKKSIETIWDENKKFNKMDEYGKCEEKKEEIIQELVDYIENYITRITKD